MKVTISILLILLMIACGGLSDPLLTDAKLDLKANRNDEAYTKLSNGLYSADGQNAMLKKIPEAWFSLGKLHAGKKEYEKMMTCFNNVIDLEKMDKDQKFTKEVENYKAVAYGQMFNQAIEDFKKGAESEGDSKTELFKKVEANMLMAEKIKNTEANLYSILAKAQNQLANDTEAEKNYKKAATLEPANADFVIDLGYYYFNAKKYDLAVKTFDDVLKIDAKNKSALKYKAYSFQNNTKVKEALSAYEVYMAAYPDDSEVFNYVGSIYYQEKMYDKVISLCSGIIKANPSTDFVNYTLVVNSFFNKYNDLKDTKMAEAKKNLTSCVEIINIGLATEEYKTKGDLWGYLAIAHSSLGNKKEAKDADEKSKKYSNGN